MTIRIRFEQEMGWVIAKRLWGSPQINMIKEIHKPMKMELRYKHPTMLNTNVQQPTSEVFNDAKDLKSDSKNSNVKVESAFDKQLKVFLDKVSISDSEITSRYELTCRRIEKIFKRHVYATCKVHRFGSTVIGLGFKNCDLDIFLDLGLTDRQKSAEPSIKTTSALFSKVKRVLRSSKEFQNVVPIPQAKIPIIKFFCLPTRVSCDLSFTNNVAFHSCKLLRFCLSLDPRLKPTMMILKYWMSTNYELSRDTRKITNYPLTLMFIFYLQQPSVNLVPPIIELKKGCKPEIVEGWQVNFDETKKKYQQRSSESKDKSIPDLLRGFFEFYSKYDFETNVICPIDGLSHKRTIFSDSNKLPESMHIYKEYLETTENPYIFPVTRTMCLQDPTQLNHNATGNVQAAYLEVFQKYCFAISEVLAAEAKNDNKTLFRSLFSLKIRYDK